MNFWDYSEFKTLQLTFTSKCDFNGNAVYVEDWLREKHFDYSICKNKIELFIMVSEITLKELVDNLISCCKLVFSYDNESDFMFDLIDFKKSHYFLKTASVKEGRFANMIKQSGKINRIARKVYLAFTKKDLLSFLKYKLGSDDKWALRALQRIYEGQTQEELNEESTKELNGLGFTGFDAPILTSIYKSYLEHNKRLTPKQMNVVKKMMQKYAGQIFRSSYMNKTQLEKVYEEYLKSNLF